MLSSAFITTHVTALEFFTNDTLFIGEGNKLHVCDIISKRIISELDVLRGSSVHGIRQICSSNETEDHEKEVTVSVFGGTALVVLNVKFENEINVQILQCQKNFTEWIWDVNWVDYPNRTDTDSQSKRKTILALALAHNTLVIWDYMNKVVLHRIECAEKCILYSSVIIGNVWPDVVLAAGTVFKEVLIWGIENSQDLTRRVMPFHRLTGHEGVIFSIAFDGKLRLLVTTSDDRSLRIWKFSTLSNFCNGDAITTEMWKKGTFDMIHRLYGHQSRVWMAKILRTHIISIGEDSNMCIWNFDGVLIKKEKCGNNGSLWSLAINSKEELIVTGGNGGGVLLWKISELLDTKSIPVQTVPLPMLSGIKDSPSNVTLINGEENLELLTVTKSGYLYVYNKECWTLVYHDAALASYNVMAASPTGNFLAIGDLYGRFILFEKIDSGLWEVALEQVIHDGKIHSLLCLGSENSFASVLTCGPNGRMIVWRLQEEDRCMHLKEVNRILLPPSKQQWPSMACISSQYGHLIVGDRVGSVHTYSMCQENLKEFKKAEQSFLYIHGKNGVTDIKENCGCIYTTGRDGRILVHQEIKNGLQVLRAIKMPKELEWIGRLCFVRDSLLILGFHTTKFIAWSYNFSRPMLEVQCGGGHRSWDFAFNSSLEAKFAYVKQTDIYFCQHPFLFSFSSSLVKPSLHGKKICCVCFLFGEEDAKGNVIKYIATGGEDNRIVLQALTYSTKDLQPKAEIIYTLPGHISSVRAMSSCRLDANKNNNCLLVSVGGRAQMMIWKISVLKGELVVCQVANDFLWSVDKPLRKPWRNKGKQNSIVDPQTRYMSISTWKARHEASSRTDDLYLIATACSDAFIRIFTVTLHSGQVQLIQAIPHGNHCVLHLMHVDICGIDALISGANDGTARVWTIGKTGLLDIVLHRHKSTSSDNRQDMPNLLPTVSSLQNTSSSDGPLHLMDSMWQMQLHCSGISAADLFKLTDEGVWILCTGGDDNMLSVCILQFDYANEEIIVIKLGSGYKQNAHAAMITGIKCLTSNLVITASIDQRICCWSLEYSSDFSDVSIKLTSHILTNIPDVAHLGVSVLRNDKWSIVVCGEGMEVFQFDHKEDGAIS